MTALETQLLLARIALLGAIYAFLAGVTWVAWRDLRRARPSREAVAAPVARLIVLEGADSDRPPGASFPLAPVTTIGRDLDNHVVLADPTVSSRHAVLNRRDSAWWLEDLRSTNGTYLNGARLEPEAPALLRSGDVVQIGAVRLRVVMPDL